MGVCWSMAGAHIQAEYCTELVRPQYFKWVAPDITPQSCLSGKQHVDKLTTEARRSSDATTAPTVSFLDNKLEYFQSDCVNTRRHRSLHLVWDHIGQVPTEGMCFGVFSDPSGSLSQDGLFKGWLNVGGGYRTNPVHQCQRKRSSRFLHYHAVSPTYKGWWISQHTPTSNAPLPQLGVRDVHQSSFPHQPQNHRLISLSDQPQQPHHQSQPVKMFRFIPPLLSPLRSPPHVCLLLSSNSFKLIFLQILFRSNRSDQNPFYQQRVRPGPQATICTPQPIFSFLPEDSNGYPRG